MRPTLNDLTSPRSPTPDSRLRKGPGLEIPEKLFIRTPGHGIRIGVFLISQYPVPARRLQRLHLSPPAFGLRSVVRAVAAAPGTWPGNRDSARDPRAGRPASARNACDGTQRFQRVEPLMPPMNR